MSKITGLRKATLAPSFPSWPALQVFGILRAGGSAKSDSVLRGRTIRACGRGYQRRKETIPALAKVKPTGTRVALMVARTLTPAYVKPPSSETVIAQAIIADLNQYTTSNHLAHRNTAPAFRR